MIKNIFSLFLILWLGGCTIFYKYGVYKAEDKSMNSDMSWYYAKNIITTSIGNDIKILQFRTNSQSLFYQVPVFIILPIAFGHLDEPKIENNDNYFIVYIERINDDSFDTNFTFSEEKNVEITKLLEKLNISLNKDGKIYKSTLNMPKPIKWKSKDGYFYREHIKYEFPIKIKDIGKEGATLIIEYNGIKKEIPFVYEYGWMYQ